MTNPSPSNRWFHPTPGRFAIGLLAVEVLLWLSDRFRWLPKGWPALIAVAAVGVVVLGMFVWFGVALVFRQRFQFSLRSLLVLVVAMAVPCSWLAAGMKRAKSQAHMVSEVERLGGRVDDDLVYFSAMQRRRCEPREPQWIRTILGDEFFRDVWSILLEGPGFNDEQLRNISDMAVVESVSYLCLVRTRVTDAGLVGLQQWTALYGLLIQDTAITEAGLENLKTLRKLDHVILTRTQVTDEGVAKLQQALPNCKITR